jgi:hypothetical protein
MVVSAHSLELSKVASGLMLVFNSVNLKLFGYNLRMVLIFFVPALQPTAIPLFLLLILVLMLLDDALSVLGMALCWSAPVPSGARALAGSAFLLSALSLLTTLGLFLPQVLRMQIAGAEPSDPTLVFGVTTALGVVSHLVFLAFSWRLARAIQDDALARWPLLLFGVFVAVALLGAVLGVADGPGVAIGVVWIGSSLWLCLYAYFLLSLRQGVLEQESVARNHA